jgi:hypothetical protein
MKKKVKKICLYKIKIYLIYKIVEVNKEKNKVMDGV